MPTPSIGISWNISRIACRKRKRVRVTSGIYQERVVHNYFIPWHREYSGQHNRYDIREAHDGKVKCNTNLLLTERESRTREYWPEVMAVQTERREVSTKTTEGQYSPVRLELARLVSSLLYGTRAMRVLNLPAFENKKYTADDRFHGNAWKRSVFRNPDICTHLIWMAKY